MRGARVVILPGPHTDCVMLPASTLRGGSGSSLSHMDGEDGFAVVSDFESALGRALSDDLAPFSSAALACAQRSEPARPGVGDCQSPGARGGDDDDWLLVEREYFDWTVSEATLQNNCND